MGCYDEKTCMVSAISEERDLGSSLHRWLRIVVGIGTVVAMGFSMSIVNVNIAEFILKIIDVFFIFISHNSRTS